MTSRKKARKDKVILTFARLIISKDYLLEVIICLVVGMFNLAVFFVALTPHRLLKTLYLISIQIIF